MATQIVVEKVKAIECILNSRGFSHLCDKLKLAKEQNKIAPEMARDICEASDNVLISRALIVAGILDEGCVLKEAEKRMDRIIFEEAIEAYCKNGELILSLIEKASEHSVSWGRHLLLVAAPYITKEQHFARRMFNSGSDSDTAHEILFS